MDSILALNISILGLNSALDSVFFLVATGLSLDDTRKKLVVVRVRLSTHFKDSVKICQLPSKKRHCTRGRRAILFIVLLVSSLSKFGVNVTTLS